MNIFIPLKALFTHTPKVKFARVFLILVLVATCIQFLQLPLHRLFTKKSSKHPLIYLTLQKDEWNKAIHFFDKNEILIEGKMFDIKSISYRENGDIVLYGHYDHKESNLLSKKNSTKDEIQNKNSILVFAFYFFEKITHKTLSKYLLIEPKKECYVINNYKYLYLQKVELPPDTIA